MKMFLFLITLFSVLSAYAQEERSYARASATSAIVTIKTGEDGGMQAAEYIDGQESEQFIKQLMNDAESPVAELKKQLELANCETTSTPDSEWIESCGQVVITETVQTAFGRGGWMSAMATHTFFIGFMNAGTGRYFEASHMVSFSESVEAQVNEETYDYLGVMQKNLSLGKIVKLEIEEAK